MADGFIVMRIGDAELDRACAEAMLPAIKACGLDPKRVDKHNKGGVLKGEIVDFLKGAAVIVADLTGERPNCYLEVGYAMGLGRHGRLVLTARKDHDVRSADHQSGGPRVHFDLDGYDILYWEPDKLDVFQVELEKRVRRRLANKEGADDDGHALASRLAEFRATATPGLQKSGLRGFVEVVIVPQVAVPPVAHKRLLEIARYASAQGTGWPLGVVVGDGQNGPKPLRDGIYQEFATDVIKPSYDYWVLLRDGLFYSLRSLYGDPDEPQATLSFVRAVVRVAEVLLYAARLSEKLGMDKDLPLLVRLNHGGLRGRVLVAPQDRIPLFTVRMCNEDSIETEVVVSRADIMTDFVALVETVAHELLVLFDFFELPQEEYARILDPFAQKHDIRLSR